MSSSLPLVMIVDKDGIYREMLENMLEDEVLVMAVGTAEDCLEALEYQKPDLIVVDPAGNEIEGFKFIETIREKLEHHSVSIIVLTRENNFDTRLKSYEAGANDFLAKPFQPEEFLAKVQLNLNSKQFYRKLKQDAVDAMQTAMAAMKQSNDLGLVLRFMEETIKTDSLASLADVLHSYLSQFAIECGIMIVDQQEAQYFHCQDEAQEAMLMAMCKDKGRLVDVGLVTVANGEYVTILVREMPKDETRYGEVKDILSIMINLADARAESIATLLALREEKQFGLQVSVKRGIERIHGMQAQVESHTETVNAVISGLRGRISESMLSIGATEEQENTLLEMVDDYLEDMEKAASGLIMLETDFKALIDELSELIASNPSAG